MDEIINLNMNALICLLQLIGFKIIYEPNNLGLPKRGDNYHLSNKNFKINVSQVNASTEDQLEPLVIPELTDENKQRIHEKLTSILGIISDSKNNWGASPMCPKNNNTEIQVIRRGSSINVSKSFTVHHNVLVNMEMETSDICTSPPARSSSPVVSTRPVTPFGLNGNSITDMLKKARNLIDLAMEISAKSGANSELLGLNSTFTKDETVEQSRSNAPRISNIHVISPLADTASKDVDSNQQLLDITNITNTIANHAPVPKKLFGSATCINYMQKNDSMEKKVKRAFTKISIFKQPSKVTGVTGTRNSPLMKMTENRRDTPRPNSSNRSISTSNLSSPYLRTTPRSTTNSTLNTPSPSYMRTAENRPAPSSGLRKPGWCAKK